MGYKHAGPDEFLRFRKQVILGVEIGGFCLGVLAPIIAPEPRFFAIAACGLPALLVAVSARFAQTKRQSIVRTSVAAGLLLCAGALMYIFGQLRS
ncbi:hypothetical protein [Herbihabitans rhizosphaerae]|uniref:hypothetical protein n=1 Tax=Herbihabitans rhizosphaerae TaxID=1872711 RepID=UPI00102B63E3|nr:hypothetical protein [Herbihabitans rhizosphaerae]